MQAYRQQPDEIDPEQAAPFLPWDDMYAYLRQNFRQGEHVSILGPTGTGKTHMALAIAEIRDYVIVIATKPKDRLVDDVIRRGYYRVSTRELNKGVEYVDGRPLHPRMVYWPQFSEQQARRLPAEHLIEARKRFQRPLVAGALGYVDLNGHWCVVLDEGTWIYKDLRLGNEVDAALNQWRSNKASLIVLGQRPAWMGRYVMAMPTHVFLFQTANVEDAKALGDISGTNTKQVRNLVQHLDHTKHEALYVNARTRQMFRTVAPPR